MGLPYREVQARPARTLSHLQDAETGERGFIITGRADFLEPYDRALMALGQDLSGLAAAVVDNPVQVRAGRG